MPPSDEGAGFCASKRLGERNDLFSPLSLRLRLAANPPPSSEGGFCGFRTVEDASPYKVAQYLGDRFCSYAVAWQTHRHCRPPANALSVKYHSARVKKQGLADISVWGWASSGGGVSPPPFGGLWGTFLPQRLVRTSLSCYPYIDIPAKAGGRLPPLLSDSRGRLSLRVSRRVFLLFRQSGTPVPTSGERFCLSEVSWYPHRHCRPPANALSVKCHSARVKKQGLAVRSIRGWVPREGA